MSISTCRHTCASVAGGSASLCLKSRSFSVTFGSAFSASVAYLPSVDPFRSYFSWMGRSSGIRLFITTIRMLRLAAVVIRISPRKRGSSVESERIRCA